MLVLLTFNERKEVTHVNTGSYYVSVHRIGFVCFGKHRFAVAVFVLLLNYL